MKINNECVVALTWELKDTLGGMLDVLDTPTEFLVGSNDLLEAIQRALQGRMPGARIDLHLEPEDAFGDYDERLVFLERRSDFPADLGEGTTLDAEQLATFQSGDKSASPTYVVTEVYPEHVVLDGNHPLAGIGLQLSLKVESVRRATQEELALGTCGNTFFRLPTQDEAIRPMPRGETVAPSSTQLH